MLDDALYVYRITKDNHWIERKAKVDYGDKSWSDKCEKHDPRLKWKHVKNLHDFRGDWFKFSENQKRLEDFIFCKL